MKASIGLADFVAAGTCGRATGFRTQRSFLSAENAAKESVASGRIQRRSVDTTSPPFSLLYYSRDHHLDDATESVVRADRAIAELAAGGRLPVVARAVVFVI